jgi:hypothetical protein
MKVGKKERNCQADNGSCEQCLLALGIGLEKGQKVPKYLLRETPIPS